MKLAVFDNYRVGIVDGDMIHDITDVVPGAGDETWPPNFVNRMIDDWPVLRERVEGARKHAKRIPIDAVALLPPNPGPCQIVAAPANYRKHIAEMGDLAVTPKGKSAAQQGVFLKAPSSVTGPSRGIELPRGSKRRFDHESELAVIIGTKARNVPRDRAMQHVFGYTCLIDVTMRIDGEKSEERSMRKSFDTFTPIGPWIVTADELIHPGNLETQLFVNGERRQSANTADMIVSVPELIEIASSVMTLWPGDIIATGTPEGIGAIKAGDIVAIKIEGIGEMHVPVRETDAVPPRIF